MIKWRWVPGYKNKYRVSNKGTVRSVDRHIAHWRGGTSFISGKVLKQSTDKDGYKFVSLSKYGKWYPFRVHQLVLLAFVGPCPEGMECRHLDGDKSNNKLSNLRWGTRKQNASDRVRHGTSKVNQGVKHGMAKLSEGKVKELREMYGSGEYTMVELASIFDLHGSASVHSIIHRKTWRHI